MRIKSASVAIAAAAAFAAIAAPMAASAQSYGYSQNYGSGSYAPSYNYGARPQQQAPDYCSLERRGRTGNGALLGGGAGAIIGSQMASRGRRTEGSVLGGVVGALIGSQIGRSSSDNCEAFHGSGSGQPGYGPAGYGQRVYDEPVYNQPQYEPQYAPNNDRYSGGYDDYRDEPRGRPMENYKNSDGCQLAESEIRLPDGRRDVRYVRTCPDASGRYRVVD